MSTFPDTLTHFRTELEGAIAEDLRRRRGRARVVRPLAGAAALALVGGVLASTLLGGGGPSIVDRAEAALNVSGSILHTKMVGTQTEQDGSVTRWEDEAWQLSSGDRDARRQVETTADGGRAETALTADGQAQVYDPATNTIYSADAARAKAAEATGTAPGKAVPKPAAMTPSAKEQVPPKATTLGSKVDAPRTPDQKIRLLLQAGALREDGHVRVDGRDAIRLVSDHEDLTYLVDADTFAPLEWTTHGEGGTVTLRFSVYETLPATSENEALLSLTAQHPDAAVDTDPTDYATAQSRLFPKG